MPRLQLMTILKRRIDNVGPIIAKDLYISLQICVFKLQLCKKLANCNVIEIKRLVLMSLVLFIKINAKKYDKMIFGQKGNYLTFQTLYKNRRVVRLDFL